MKKEGNGVKKLIVSLAVAVLVVGLSVGGALAKSEKQSATVQACVLLPDTKSSVRWETQDRPTFIAAFKKAGIPATVVNAEGDAQRQRSQADQCLANGAKVILMTSLDPGSGCAIIKAATARKVRDDRLRPAQHRLQGRELLRLVRQHDGRQVHGSGRARPR